MEKPLALTIQYHSSIDVEAAVSAHFCDDNGSCTMDNDVAELLLAFSHLLVLHTRNIANNKQQPPLITEDLITIVFDTLTGVFKLFDSEYMHTLLQAQSSSGSRSIGNKRKISDKTIAAKVSSLLRTIVSILHNTRHYWS